MPSSATIASTDFTYFSNSSGIIKSAEVMGNFNIFRGHFIPVNTDTSSSSDNTHDLGAVGHQWKDARIAGTIYKNGTAAYQLGSVQMFTATATYTRPTACVAVFVRAWGPGGGGGGALGTASNSAGGSGGGGGGYSELFSLLTTATVSVVIGTGGNGGTLTGSDGVAGSGATSFGTLVVANAGQGGTGDAAPTTVSDVTGLGGAGGVIGTGGLSIPGEQGGVGFVISHASIVSGRGGSSPNGGSGGANKVGSADGNAGEIPGGGGSGASTNSATDRNGGAGARGQVIVFEYY